MIPVQLAPEPADFDQKVRQPGLRAMAELVGEALPQRRRGRPRKKITERREEIPPEKFPDYWRQAMEDMLLAYHRLCAYTAFYIHRVTGASSVDHMIPKSRQWHQVYEWSNYRLSCLTMNSRKRDFTDVLDPCQIGHGWFVLELVGFQVKAGGGLSQADRMAVEKTIERLRLNDYECCKRREEDAQYYWEKRDFAHLQRINPFVAQELDRQGER